MNGERPQDVLDSLDEHIAVLDEHGTIVRVNEAWRSFGRANGLPEHYEPVGDNYLSVCRNASGTNDEEAQHAKEGLQAVLERREPVFTREYPCHSPSEQRWFLMRVTPLAHSAQGVVVSHLNITDRKLAELEVMFLAQHDPLTGCLNRRAFFEKAALLLELAKRQQQPLALVFCDLNGFKPINDDYGHEAGDVLIQHVAARMRERTRSVDLLARFGGDEFVLLLYGVQAHDVPNLVQSFAQQVATPLEHDGVTLQVQGAFGVALFPEHGHDLKQLVMVADKAMYLAKQQHLTLYLAPEQA